MIPFEKTFLINEIEVAPVLNIVAALEGNPVVETNPSVFSSVPLVVTKATLQKQIRLWNKQNNFLNIYSPPLHLFLATISKRGKLMNLPKC